MLTRYTERHLTWIDLVSPSPQEARAVMHEFGIDPAIAEELLVPSYKQKVERRGDYIYVILHFPVLRGMQQRPQEEIDFIIGKNFLVTARYSTSEKIHAFAKAFEVRGVLGRGAAMTHGGHLFAAMAHNLYQALLSECDALGRKLYEIEEQIFSGDERHMVIEISQTGRVIHDFRQALLPHEEMLASLEPAATRLYGPEYGFYMHSVEGEYRRVRDTVNHLREALTELRETNNSLLNTKQNEIMKTLTVMAFIFLPLSFIASLFQMNTRYTPIVGLPGDFWIIVGSMVVLAAGCFVFFRHKGWI